MIFSPQSKGKQLTYYFTVTEYFPRYIQKSYEQVGQDVTNILKDMNTVYLDSEDTTRKTSTKKYDKIKSIENTGYDIKYQEELRRYLDRRDYLKARLTKEYTILYAIVCTKAMQSQL